MKISDLENPTNSVHKNEAARVSAKHADFLQWAHKHLKSAGWTRYDNRIRSAMFSKSYEKGQRQISFYGWHGTGAPGTCRNYGSLKLIFGLADNQPNNSPTRLAYQKEFMTLNFIDGTVDDADEFLHKLRIYIQNL